MRSTSWSAALHSEKVKAEILNHLVSIDPLMRHQLRVGEVQKARVVSTICSDVLEWTPFDHLVRTEWNIEEIYCQMLNADKVLDLS